MNENEPGGCATPYEETDYGFNYGSAVIERLCSDHKKGWVVIGIGTPKQVVQVYVTKTGKVRVHVDGQEWHASDR